MTHTSAKQLLGPGGNTGESLTARQQSEIRGEKTPRLPVHRADSCWPPRTCLELACVTVLDEVTDPVCAGSVVRGLQGSSEEQGVEEPGDIELLYIMYRLSEPYIYIFFSHFWVFMSVSQAFHS